jgi:hypothetical protein
VRQKESKIPLHVFPAPAYDPSFLNLRRHLVNHEFCPSWYKFFDFNLLFFLTTTGGLSLDDIKTIGTSRLQKKEVPDALIKIIERKVNMSPRGKRLLVLVLELQLR